MFGIITTTLRPLKFAFLVQPGDRSGLREAMELNTILWGGQFNPIIPTYQRLPSGWHRTARTGTARDVFTGYLEAFDPDYVVPVGKVTEPPFPVGHRSVLSAKAVLGKFEETGTVGYGLGLFDVLRQFVEEELRFIRHDPLRIVLPEPYRQYPLFLASALGALSSGTASALRRYWTEPLSASWRPCEGHSYAELFDRNTFFPRRLSCLFIKGVHGSNWGDRDCVFVMDAGSMVDIIDFWNLRAIGWNVIPAPVQFIEHAGVRDLANGFIDENFFPLRHNRSVHNRTTILKSQSITAEQVERFIGFLDTKPKAGSEEPKITIQRWYPRIWDSWARRHDHAGTIHLEADTRSQDIPEGRTELHLRTLDPKFMSRFGSAAKIAFANTIDLKFYGDSKLVAEVLPDGDETLARAIGAVGLAEWRFSSLGMTYLSSHKDWRIHLDIPDAESVFVEWFRQRDWSVELSSSGRIAKQTCLALGGVWGLGILTDEGIVELLGRMSDGRSVGKKAFLGEISRISNERRFPVEAERLVKIVTDKRMFRLGLEVQCPVCTQRSWYSLEDLGYRLQCMKCLERFDVPSHSPDDLAWSYRSFGPFSLPAYAQGAYSVLLTFYFFSRKLEGATTPIMSFNATKGQVQLEADLGLFFNQHTFGRTVTELLFVECKSYGRFEQKDVDRLCRLGSEFPGAILVFATLREKLTSDEKRLLRRVANRGRKYSTRDPNHNPVLVLTGIELFGHERPPDCWEGARGKFEEFAKGQRGYGEILELCDCTQQLHLDMDAYYEWLDNRLDRRSGARR